MYLVFDSDAKGMHTQHATFYACDRDSLPKRLSEAGAGLWEYGEITITVTKPIEQLPVEESETGERRVFDYIVQIEIVGGSVQITLTSAARGDGGKVVGKLVLPKLDTI